MAKRYSAKFKFQIVLEAIQDEKSIAQIAKAYGVHPNTVHKWKKEFLAKGADVFDQKGIVSDYEKKLSDLEQLLGKKEVEIALLKNFLGHTK